MFRLVTHILTLNVKPVLREPTFEAVTTDVVTADFHNEEQVEAAKVELNKLQYGVGSGNCVRVEVRHTVMEVPE